MSSPKRRIETDVMNLFEVLTNARLMSDYEVTLVNDNSENTRSSTLKPTIPSNL
ncbi:MAG: Ubiquitin-conjugating enzyme E2 8 [Geoglossum simile]|nr:MAG: Ubiquitin-conjugating enzyme E2 8 [Geoglossum simile]